MQDQQSITVQIYPLKTTTSSHNTVNPETLSSIRQASDAVISPDGKQIAFIVREFVQDQPRLRARIWLIDTVQGTLQQLTSGPYADTSPAWSPDSTQIAFASKRAETENTSKVQLYVISVHGGQARQICSTPGNVSDICWSPDGTRIAFLCREKKKSENDPLLLHTSHRNHQRLWTIRSDSDTPEPVTPDGLSIWHYAWSPDNQRFAVYYALGPEETDWYRGQIGIVAAAGGAIQQIGQLTQQAYGFAWSPDGTRLAYISGEWSDPDRGGGDIYILTLANQQTRHLTPRIDWSPSWCHWFPDGKHLLCAGWSGLSCRISTVDAMTGAMHTLADDFVLGDRLWPHLSTTPDMRYIAATHSEQHPYDVWLGELKNEQGRARHIAWKRLSQLNPIAEETLTLAPSERIHYKSEDGWTIEACTTWPFQQGKKTPPPLIVNIHGGPSGIWVDDWDFYRSHLLAAAGYAVLRPNIRGSMGRGADFANAVLGDMGGKDLQDILHGIDYLVKRGLVDATRIGIMGWSYGGFMAAWAITQTTRFKAAIMGAGICDFHSFHAQTNIQDWDMRFLDRNKQVSPLTHPDIYRQRSAITYVQRVTTPTLIVHGEQDVCVPVNQAYAFYRALEEQGVPAEAVIYPREGHGLTERKHLCDYHQRVLDWFERYL